MSDQENEDNEKPFPKDSQVEENNVNEDKNDEDNNFPEEQKNLVLPKGKNNIYDIVYTNINYKKNSLAIKKYMEKYYYEITELKIDNELLEEELELRKEPHYSVLIRCMEFYRRTNLKIYFDIKIFKKALNKIEKILQFLDFV